jgi:amino acid transporter
MLSLGTQERPPGLPTRSVVLLAAAAACPTAAILGNFPLALVYGNGAAFPVAFLLSGAVLLCFCAGYAAMSRHVANAGGFFPYVSRGLGRVPAVAAGYLAAFAYTALAIGNAAAFGYFAQLILREEGITLSWAWPTFAALLLVGLLGYRSVALSAKMVGVLVIAAFAVILVLDFGIVAHHGVAAFPTAAVSPRGLLSRSIGVGLAFAFTCFVGFESAVLYSQETADPRRSVPRAAFISVAALGVLYFLTAWLTVGALGVTHAHDRASSELADLFFNLSVENVGGVLRDAIAVLACLGVLAALLAIQNAASRYIFTLGREGALPSALGRYHTRHLSPHIASVTVSMISAAVVLIFVATGLDPYLTLVTSMIGLSTLGVVLLQAIAAVSVVAFFVRTRDERGYLRTLVVPALGAAGLVVAFALTAANFRDLVGTRSVVVGGLPWLLTVVVAAGLAAGAWQQRRQTGVRRHAGVGRPAAAHGDVHGVPDQRHPEQRYPDQRYPDQRYPDQRDQDQWHHEQPYSEQRRTSHWDHDPRRTVPVDYPTGQQQAIREGEGARHGWFQPPGQESR